MGNFSFHIQKLTLLFVASSFILVFCSFPAHANTPEEDYFDLPLESLMNIVVTSVSKKEEKISEAAAAIHVITNEDIRRAGATSIPEALRLAPGIQVSQITSNKWAISTRGFTDQLATKLLVLIDGRSVYTPLFSGVNWDVHDTLIEDIDRIEVIRGPGGTLWGANAVNGVINIITKKAKDTTGTMLTATYGNLERGAAAGRKGGKIGENLFYRTYAKHFNRDEMETLTGEGANDAWHMSQAGFRTDWDKSSQDSFTFSGDTYYGEQDRKLSLPSLSGSFVDTRVGEEQRGGGNLLGRWNRKIDEDSETSLQMYFDYIRRDNPETFEQRRLTFDVDFQHHLALDARNEFIWGVGFRRVADHLTGTIHLDIQPDGRSDNLWNAFLQNKYAVIPEELFVTVGSKFEHNNYTGFEYQPNVRMAWLPHENQTVWAAASRSVRTPSRAEDDISIIVANLKPGFIRWQGNRDFESEELMAYELGYRIQPNRDLFFDVALFFNDYSNLRSFETSSPFIDSSITGVPPHLVVPIPFGNNAYGETYGFEIASNWNVRKNWELSAAYSFITMDLHLKDGSSDTIAQLDENKTAKNHFNLRSHLQLPHNVELDNTVYYTDNLSAIKIPGFIRFDSRLGWTVVEGFDLNLVGLNLFDDRHQEFSAPLHSQATEIRRSFYLKAIWHF